MDIGPAWFEQTLKNPTSDTNCQVFTLFVDFTFTLEQILMFLGDQTNLFVDTTIESACRFYSNPNTLFKLTVTLES